MILLDTDHLTLLSYPTGSVRIGSMDLKIACIGLVHDALVLSGNLQDFQKVPGLRVENWLS
jgi:predicted nucleic acid-binding protein